MTLAVAAGVRRWVAAVGLAAAAVAHAAPAAAQQRPLEVSLWLDNDNLLLGGWSAMAGIEDDGSDFGRTHASGIAMIWNALPERLALRLDATTELFTRPLQPVGVYDFATFAVHFHELDRYRVGATWTRPGAPWHAAVGIGVDLSNRSAITPGASGQQQLWHDIARAAGNDILWQFVYVPDGTPVAAGAALDGTIGATHRASIAPWLHVRARSDAGLRLTSLVAGCQTFGELELVIAAGDRDDLRGELAVRQRGELWLVDPNVSMRTTVELAIEGAVLRAWIAVHWWTGDPRTSFYVHAFSNETMTLGVTARVDGR